MRTTTFVAILSNGEKYLVKEYSVDAAYDLVNGYLTGTDLKCHFLGYAFEEFDFPWITGIKNEH